MTRGQRESEERIKELVEQEAHRQTALDRTRDDLAHEITQFTGEKILPSQVRAIVTAAAAIRAGMQSKDWPKIYKAAALAVKRIDKLP